MKMPSKYSTWAMILFFLFAGLSALGVSVGGSIWGILTGIFALAAAVLLFLNM
ncbi:MAG TPA: hypothetical protein VLZ89_15445 [Anaerolineales bacterium]|nr:hypothetical protein [Anaerolineales bacterium]